MDNIKEIAAVVSCACYTHESSAFYRVALAMTTVVGGLRQAQTDVVVGLRQAQTDIVVGFLGIWY